MATPVSTTRGRMRIKRTVRCPISLVSKVLLRAIQQPSPEASLIAAVICQSIADANGRNNEEGVEDAIRFLRGERLDFMANLIGINPEWVREIAVRSGYLAPLVEEMAEEVAA